jgi:hypothetical protein
VFLLSAAAAGPAKAAELDGELLALCDEAIAADDQVKAIDDSIAELRMKDPRYIAGDLHARRLMAVVREHEYLVTQIAPRTPEGLRAKARLALRNLSGSGADFPLVEAMLRDLVGRA